MKCPKDVDAITYCEKVDKLMGYYDDRRHKDMKLDPAKVAELQREPDPWLKQLIKVCNQVINLCMLF